MFIFINNNYIEENSAYVNVISQGFMYGYGIFETIQIQEGRTVYPYEHLNRMKNSAKVLNMEFNYNSSMLDNICEKLIRMNEIKEGFIKIVLSLGTNGGSDFIVSTGLKSYRDRYNKGCSLILANSRRNEYSKLTYVKSLNYFENIIEQKSARSNGFDEAIFLNTKGYIAEGCISNIFWTKKGEIYTPAISCGILPGIIREKVINFLEQSDLKVNIDEFCLEVLYEADEVFITNSLMGVMPVYKFSDKTYHLEKYKIVKWLMESMNR